MNDIKTKIIIPFRDRGIDLRRGANLDVVQAWWHVHGYETHIVSDGLSGAAQFNRHRAYNRAVAVFPETEVFVFAEADMLVPPAQIGLAVRLARRAPGLVVPFTQYRYWSDATTAWLRDAYHDQSTLSMSAYWSVPTDRSDSMFKVAAERVVDDGKSIGAVNVVSATTLRLTGGFTEATSGNWYDDNITEEGFAFLTGHRTAFVPGPAVHMYHRPGHRGGHLTEADRLATRRNRVLLNEMRRDIKRNRRAYVKNLMEVRA